MEISGDVTDAGRTDDDKRRTREDRATQPMDAGWLSFAIEGDREGGAHPHRQGGQGFSSQGSPSPGTVDCRLQRNRQIGTPG